MQDSPDNSLNQIAPQTYQQRTTPKDMAEYLLWSATFIERYLIDQNGALTDTTLETTNKMRALAASIYDAIEGIPVEKQTEAYRKFATSRDEKNLKWSNTSIIPTILCLASEFTGRVLKMDVVLPEGVPQLDFPDPAMKELTRANFEKLHDGLMACLVMAGETRALEKKPHPAPNDGPFSPNSHQRLSLTSIMTGVFRRQESQFTANELRSIRFPRNYAFTPGEFHRKIKIGYHNAKNAMNGTNVPHAQDGPGIGR